MVVEEIEAVTGIPAVVVTGGKSEESNYSPFKFLFQDFITPSPACKFLQLIK